LEFFSLNPAIATSSNVFWEVEPEPFSVTDPEVFDDPLELFLLELPHAARTRAMATSPMSARAYRGDAAKVRPLRSTMSTGVDTKNGAWRRSCRRVNEG
jgi:hypothetical protein